MPPVSPPETPTTRADYRDGDQKTVLGQRMIGLDRNSARLGFVLPVIQRAAAGPKHADATEADWVCRIGDTGANFAGIGILHNLCPAHCRGRVEVWRSCCRLSISVAAPFVRRCLTGSALALSPHPARQ